MGSEKGPTIKRLVEAADLLSITVFELSAVRADGPFDALDKSREPSDDAIVPSHLLQTAHRDDEHGFRVRVRTEIDVKVGFVVVDIAAEYETGKLNFETVSSKVFGQFVNDVAVMTLFPFIRQSVADLTQRVFDAPLFLPMVQRGEIAFEVEESTEIEPSVSH